MAVRGHVWVWVMVMVRRRVGACMHVCVHWGYMRVHVKAMAMVRKGEGQGEGVPVCGIMKPGVDIDSEAGFTTLSTL